MGYAMTQSVTAQPARAGRHSLPLAVQRLASHMDIAWDVDGTLLDHPASPLLHRFILDTPHIRHVIVTFRSERQGNPWGRLVQYGAGLGPEAFARTMFLPDELSAGLADETARRGSLWSGIPRLLRRGQRGFGAAHRAWKARVCEQEGITALVDDLTSVVASSCQRHGVELFHPADFLPVC